MRQKTPCFIQNWILPYPFSDESDKPYPKPSDDGDDCGIGGKNGAIRSVAGVISRMDG